MQLGMFYQRLHITTSVMASKWLIRTVVDTALHQSSKVLYSCEQNICTMSKHKRIVQNEENHIRKQNPFSKGLNMQLSDTAIKMPSIRLN